MIIVVINIYEGGDYVPILKHELYGETLEAALAVVDAHMVTDKFFEAAMLGQRFRGIHLRTTVALEEREVRQMKYLEGRFSSHPLRYLHKLAKEE